ncbi:MAG TPA: hypothetical protein VMM84_04895 [Pyrinomonadaceae bacterium]|nr:hypothetical protein [Pyrinomonadaceae bacterium]
MRRWFGSRALVVFVALAVIAGSAYTVAASFLSGQSQDVMRLDRRISLIEQRFYAMESRLNRLEQQAVSQRPSSPTTAGRDGEINLIINEIGEVRRRLVEVECGVVRLDERTLANRGKPDKARGNHPCRLNSDEPVSIPLRP